MSGEAGVWPIGPAANPAKPAPSLTMPSKFDIGTSLADGLACMSTNWAKKNSIPSASACRRTCSASAVRFSVATAIAHLRLDPLQALPIVYDRLAIVHIAWYDRHAARRGAEARTPGGWIWQSNRVFLITKVGG